MRELDKSYKDFIIYKIFSFSTYVNLIKKIRNFEDLRFTWGLVWFALTKIVFKKRLTNENIRGR